MKRILLIIFGITTFVSCDKKGENDFPELIHNDLEYKLNLPDTVILNKPYKITIDFNSDFDQIIDAVQINPHDTTKVRLITYYNYKPIKSPMKSLSGLSLIDSTFVVNKNFEIENIIFKEKGEYIFCGFLKDVVMNNHYNENGIRDSVTFDDLRQQIYKKVIVIE